MSDPLDKARAALEHYLQQLEEGIASREREQILEDLDANKLSFASVARFDAECATR